MYPDTGYSHLRIVTLQDQRKHHRRLGAVFALSVLLLVTSQSVSAFSSRVSTAAPELHLDDPLLPYRLERTVTIRPVRSDGPNQSDTVWQWYKGQSFVAPDIQQAQVQSKHVITNLCARLDQGLSVNEAVRQSVADTGRTADTSHALWSETTVRRLATFATLNELERTLLTIKLAAELRASRPVRALDHVRILYVDEAMCVVHKPSGVLAVPGPRRNPSLCEAVYNLLAPTALSSMDQMVVHRLDMDTSGILVFALTPHALTRLHDEFRHRRVQKTYQALVHGHVPHVDVEINVALERDPLHPPFMRIVQPNRNQHVVDSASLETRWHPSSVKFLNEAPKPSLTQWQVLEWTRWPSVSTTRGSATPSFPVTRLSLVPHTGRTHQLRVHTAALGYPIVGDDIYGVKGEGDSGGFRPKANHAIHDTAIPLCLHAHRLCLRHPVTGYPIMFECDPPF